MVAKELKSGQTWRRRRGEFDSTPPFSTDASTLFVAYYASAELGCFRALGWPTPARILDLFTEFRSLTNGLTTPAGNGLVGALIHFNLDTIGTLEKDTLRARILRGEPCCPEFLDYCTTDTDALERLLPAMLPGIDLPRALLRGRYMAAAAAMEFNGVPIDVPTLTALRRHWHDIQDQLIRAIDVDYGVLKGARSKSIVSKSFLPTKVFPGRDWRVARLI